MLPIGLGANGVFFSGFLDANGVYNIQTIARLITVAETPLFVRQTDKVWTDAEREEFVDFIAGNPEVGDVIPETGGVPKVRLGSGGSGKRGGARVIYFHHDVDRPL